MHKLRWNHADCVLWDAVSFFVFDVSPYLYWKRRKNDYLKALKPSVNGLRMTCRPLVSDLFYYPCLSGNLN
ncbi:hypothetical protein EA458_02185 [Streptococcus dysgalactiae subsp. dysgalactiae]|nr:hypothetical protein EA458_02185 [Streptococcus dysgalactiae subsp. dysgalactiae]